MKSIKITLEHCNYPLFIDTGLLNRLNEFCDLYRFPVKRTVLMKDSETKKLHKFWRNGENFEIVSIPDEILHAELNSILKIFDYLPWETFSQGVTLVVIGEDWLVRSAALIKQHANFPIYLVCVPTSFWSMLEIGVNDVYLLNWKQNNSVLKSSYCPNLILLDVDLLSWQNADDPLLGITVVLRHLLQVNPDIFHLFKSNIQDVFSDKSQENVQIVEELVNSRLSLFQNQNEKNCLKDFGVRFVEAYQLQLQNMVTPRELALTVLMDVCWRWKISKDLKICRANETDSIFSLIEKICINTHITSSEWNQAKNRLLKVVSKDQLNDIYLPEAIGKFKCIHSLDVNLARQSLQDC